ncbi:putative transposase-related protein [Brucella sp. BO2]|nr:putative transposase-related protein [Brucella sp. BO2]
MLYTGSTHLKANANKGKYDLEMIARSRADYWADLDRAIDVERALHGQKPMTDKQREQEAKATKVSRTDPESGYMVRDGKPKGFYYLDHRTVDGKLAIITDIHVAPANVHDSRVYLDRLDRQRRHFDFEVGAVGLDAGYATAAIARRLEDRHILGVTGYRTPTPPRDGMMRKSKFAFEADADGFGCTNARNKGTCNNRLNIRRDKLEA